MITRGAIAACLVAAMTSPASGGELVELPEPRLDGSMSLERALAERRSRRQHSAEPLSRAELGQLLWAAQGITDRQGHRTAPSAGARYPLEIYVLTGEGLFRYLPAKHALDRVSAKDLRASVPSIYARPALQRSTAFIITAAYQRTRARYGASTERFVHIEAGHVGQNVLLQATALGLHAVPVGAFDRRRVAARLGLAGDPVYVIDVGRPPSR